MHGAGGCGHVVYQWIKIKVQAPMLDCADADLAMDAAAQLRLLSTSHTISKASICCTGWPVVHPQTAL